MFAHVKFGSALVGLVCIAAGCMNGGASTVILMFRRLFSFGGYFLPGVVWKHRTRSNQIPLSRLRVSMIGIQENGEIVFLA
jgi:hypothetical protein